MKHNYKIRLDEPDPSDEAIDRHRNFDRVLADHRNLTEPLYRRPLYRNPRAFLGLLLIVVLAFLVFEAVEEEREAQDLAEMPAELREAEERAFLNPPLPALLPDAEQFSALPARDTEFVLASGTRILLGAEAFRLPEGAAGPLDISVRELHDPFDALLAGLPLAPAGGGGLAPTRLYQIEASIGGTPLGLQSGRGIRIESAGASNLFETDEVLFALDTASRRWVPQGKGVEVEERRTAPGKAHLDDGFGSVEYNADGSVKHNEVQHEEEAPGKSVWVSTFQSSGTGWVMCGDVLPDVEERKRVQLVDAGGKTLPIVALYQVALDGKALRVNWPVSKDHEFKVVPEGTLFGFLADGRMAWVADWKEAGSLSANVSDTPISSKEEIKRYLGLNAQ